MDQNLDYDDNHIKGTDLIKKLRSQGYAGKIAIRSANNSAQDCKFYIEQGADCAIPKSCSMKELVKYIVETLDNSKQSDNEDEGLGIEGMDEIVLEFYQNSLIETQKLIAQKSLNVQTTWYVVHKIKGGAMVTQQYSIVDICESMRGLNDPTILRNKLQTLEKILLECLK